MSIKKLVVLAGYIFGLVVCGSRQTVFDRAGVATLIESSASDTIGNW